MFVEQEALAEDFGGEGRLAAVALQNMGLEWARGLEKEGCLSLRVEGSVLPLKAGRHYHLGAEHLIKAKAL